MILDRRSVISDHSTLQRCRVSCSANRAKLLQFESADWWSVIMTQVEITCCGAIAHCGIEALATVSIIIQLVNIADQLAHDQWIRKCNWVLQLEDLLEWECLFSASLKLIVLVLVNFRHVYMKIFSLCCCILYLFW